MTDHIAQVLRIASTLACGVIIAAFAFWATDETQATSQGQVAQIGNAGSTGAVVEPVPEPEAEHGTVRTTIEDVNATLIAPFEGVARADDVWVQHGVPALLGLLCYGLLARILIGYMPTRN